MKKKVLVSVLACALLFLGMGYAYWTDSLQVDTSVSTGELDVKFVDLGLLGVYSDDLENTGATWSIFDGISPALATKYFTMDEKRWKYKVNYNSIADQNDLDSYHERIDGYTKTEFAADLVDEDELGTDIGDYIESTMAADSIAINIKDIYPGYAQLFRADIVNPGTLAAKLGKLCFTKSYPNSQMGNMIGVSLEVMRENGTEVVNLLEGVENGTFVVGGKTFLRLSALGDEYTNIVTENNINLLSIYPEKNANADLWRMDFFIGVAMDPDYYGEWTSGSCATNSGKDDSITQLKDASFKVKLCWDQFNTTAPAE